MLQMGKHIITAVDRNTGGFSVTSNLQYFKQTTQIFPALKLSDSPGTEAVHTSFCANPPGSQQCIYNQPCCWGCFQAPKHTLSLQTHLFSVPKTHWAIIYCSPPQLCVWSMTGSRTLAVFSLCGKGPPVPTPPPPPPTRGWSRGCSGSRCTSSLRTNAQKRRARNPVLDLKVDFISFALHKPN